MCDEISRGTHEAAKIKHVLNRGGGKSPIAELPARITIQQGWSQIRSLELGVPNQTVRNGPNFCGRIIDLERKEVRSENGNLAGAPRSKFIKRSAVLRTRRRLKWNLKRTAESR